MPPITHPTALDDQFQAATDDLTGQLAHLGFQMDETIPEPWLTAWLDALFARLDTGDVQLCQHLNGASPQPTATASWRPGLIVCDNCRHQLHPGRVPAIRCARCHQPLGDELTTYPIQADALLIWVAICEHCDTPDPTHTGT